MKVLIGTVSKPQGIKGEIKISSRMDSPEQLNSVKHFYIGEKRMDVKSIRSSSNFVFAVLDEINDRNAAELLRNWDVFVDREEITVSENSFLVADLIGSMVFDDEGEFLGELSDILQYGAADVYIVSGKKNFQFPFLKDVVVSIDAEEKKIVLKKSRLAEVALYED